MNDDRDDAINFGRGIFSALAILSAMGAAVYFVLYIVL